MSKKPKPGRPTKFTPEIATEICERMIGGEDIVAICDDPSMPGRSTVYRWMDEQPDFGTRCARAREGLGDVYDHRIGEVIDACTPETAPADRVKLAGLQWRASKVAPKKYGDRVALTGEEGGAPLVVKIVRFDPDAKEG